MKRKQWIYGMIAAAVLAMPLSLSAETANAAPRTTFIGSNWGLSEKVPVIKPFWTLDIDKQNQKSSDPVYAAAAGGKIFTLKKGQLLAVNAKTGKTVWKSGSGLSRVITVAQNRVYTASSGGKVSAFDAGSGKVLWTSAVKLSDIGQVAVNTERIIVAANGDLKALNVKDGKLLWTDNYEWPIQGPLLLDGDTVLAEGYESGAYSYTVLHAFNGKTGKSIWRNSNQALPIYVDGGKAIVQRQSTLLEQLPLTTLDTLDMKTGKVLQSTAYNPEKIDVSKLEPGGGGGEALVADGKLYIITGSKVYAYPLKADPSKTKPELYTPQGVGKNLQYAAGPHEGRILFIDGYSLYGVKLADKMTVSYSTGLDLPIARFELIGRGLYAALTDGSVIAISLAKAEPVLKLEARGSEFGRTLSESGMIIIQANGRLLAFKEPQSLKAP
ncbi:PQQ-binding-like beta-propeller repeat protein [Paenibacillus sp. CN-4]|uniref:outer membrane protein assembly factor BamB family protein n=1 Tax=Paenibacillus nanchangensis TaxID=3348343 RepID=UPI00397B0682